MKKITFTFTFLLFFICQSFGQVNPVSNLVWQQQYFFGTYTFSLNWDAPTTPHDELIGYNIYRDNELFRFQAENYLTNMGVNPNCGQEFMNFVSDGDGFEMHVTAVYNPGATESDYPETAFAQNNLLSNTTFETPRALVYPNPTNGILNIRNENLNKILVYDYSGKMVKEFGPTSQIDLSDISKGIYLIKIILDKDVLIDRIIVE